MSRMAFLMGFQTLDLRYSREDVETMRAALERHAFTVTTVSSTPGSVVPKALLIDELDLFLDSCSSSDTVVVYFSGHAFAPKGELLLLLNDDLARLNASTVKLGYVTAAMESCVARRKLLILDCCHALAEIHDWRPPQSESYRILAASGRLERAKEVDSLGASFLTYGIGQAFAEFDADVGRETQLTVGGLFSSVLAKAAESQRIGFESIPTPRLMGDQGSDFVLATRPVVPQSAKLASFRQRLSACFSSCALGGCSNRYPWCRAVVELGPVSDRYVVPRVRYLGGDRRVEEIDLRQYFAQWLAEPAWKHLAILGDSGIGKSSACVYLTSVILALSAERPLIPVYLSLDGLVRNGLLGSDVAAVLRSFPQIVLDDAAIDEIVREGLLVFILDGFDEISDRADHAKIVRNLHHLDPILQSGCKVVLTCRTHLFVNNEQVEQVLAGRSEYGTELYAAFRKQDSGFAVIELQEFDESEIREVVRRANVAPVDEVMSTISDLYNLEDLARRPLLLQLILHTLPSLLGRRSWINRADLYGAYVEFWLRREIERVDTTANSDDKVRFVEDLAIEMWEQGVGALAYSELQLRVRSEYSRDILAMSDYYSKDYDTRISSFLNRDANGMYKFMHRSFMEYFAARYLVRQLTAVDGDMQYWNSRWFDRELARFLAEIVENPQRSAAIAALVQYGLVATERTLLWNALHVVSLLQEDDLRRSVGDSLLSRVVERATRENGAVILRQYCRIIDRLGDHATASRFIDRILEIVSSDGAQNADNNDTYVNYYYGKESACSALIAHLSTVEPKYDRSLHIFVLGQLGDMSHLVQLESLVKNWQDPRHLQLADLAMASILHRHTTIPAADS